MILSFILGMLVIVLIVGLTMLQLELDIKREEELKDQKVVDKEES